MVVRHEQNHLQAWRLHRQMTQEELADKVGTTKSVISNIENGERGLSGKWLRKLAPVLNTTPGRLLDYHPDQLPTDILDIWRKVPDDQKPLAKSVLERFIKSGTDG